jgi:hypothetical protein
VALKVSDIDSERMLLRIEQRIFEERNALLRYLWQIWTPAV